MAYRFRATRRSEGRLGRASRCSPWCRRGVVPVKFTQDGVATCALPAATIAVTRTSGGTTGAIDESVYVMAADNGSNFRIDSCQYVYNLGVNALGVGTYRIDIKINGQTIGSASFQLK